LLEGAEGGPPRVVDDAGLAVDHALARRELEDRLADRLEAVGPVVLAPGVEARLRPRLAREDAVAVVLHLEEVVLAVVDLEVAGREHRLADRLEEAAGAGAALRRADPARTAGRLAPADHRLGALGDDVEPGVRD